MNLTSPAQVASERYTCKSYNPNRPLDDATLQSILTALHLSPSSINIQPWKFLVASDDAAKARICHSMTGHNAHNVPKITHASHIIVLCTKTCVDADHLNAVLDAEYQAGRFADAEQLESRRALCQGYLQEYRANPDQFAVWCEQQTFIALGHLLMAAQIAGVAATAIGGFDADELSKQLGLSDKHLKASVIVALGHASDDDFNRTLPKARLAFDDVIEFL